MVRASFLVIPSLCYENFPMTLAEAFAHGLPVVASRVGALEELVEEGRTGLLFAPGDAADLAEKVRWAANHPEEMRRMGAEARTTYEREYTPEKNYRALTGIYEEATLHSSGRLEGGQSRRHP
jgi:glycosyltransferase involved in cell wall biosynthesis